MSAAVRPLASEGIPDTEAVLSSRVLPAPEVLAECLLSDLEGSPRGVLVLDELETIEAEPVYAFIRALVHAAGPTLHLVLLTRSDPPLPLSLWRTRGWMHELRDRDLRFTRDEVDRMFAASGTSLPSPEATDILHRKTQGWAAGLRLAQLSLAHATDSESRLRELSGTSRLIADYLMDEVLSAQPPETLEFLGVVAHLDRICAPLADHVLQDPGDPRGDAHAPSAAVLRRLHADNAFLNSLGTEEGWYRFHPMFRQLLVDRAPDLAPARRREDVLRRAAEWHQREGHVEEALRLLLAAGDVDGATDLVVRNLHTVLDANPSRSVLARWLSLFPATAAEDRFPLRLASCYVHLSKLDPEAILEILDEIDASSTTPDATRSRWSADLQADVDGLRGFALYFSGDLDGALHHTSQALARPRPPGAFRDGYVATYRLLTLASLGEEGEYERVLSEAFAQTLTRGRPTVPLYVAKAAVALQQGRMDECREAALRALEEDHGSPAPYYECQVAYALGTVAYELDELDEAEARFETVRRLRLETAPMISNHGLVGLAEVALARGDLESAAAAIDEALAFAREHGNSASVSESQWFKHRLDALRDPGSPVPPDPPEALDFTRFTPHTPTRQWALLHVRHRPSAEWASGALPHLDRCIARATQANVERSVLQLSIARALVLRLAGRHSDALDAMADVLRRAAPLGLVRSFVDFGGPAQALVAEAAASLPGTPWLDGLFEAFATASGLDGSEPQPVGADPRQNGRGSNPVGLTRREFSVLEQLQHRLSNKEIAAHLSIAAETVRKHTVNIYAKLGVHSRRQAVREALRQGLLDDGSS